MPSLMSAPGTASGMSVASSTRMVDLSEIMPPVYALMNAANSVLCPLLLPNLLQETVATARVAIARMAAMAFEYDFISMV